MSVVLPHAEKVCAIVVGIEIYPGLGSSFDTPGAVAGALAFARWLVVDRKVAPSAIELWLSRNDGSDESQTFVGTDLAGAVSRRFEWGTFRKAMEEPGVARAGGEFLMVYFCGHGVVSGLRNDQLLVLPEASERQFRCFEVQNWRELFRGSGWEQFQRQLWIVDACRNSWGDAMKPVPDAWQPGVAQAVNQCAMFACASGGTAAIEAQSGPRFTRELLDTLRNDPVAESGWPDFVAALKDTASRLRTGPAGTQSPTLSVGEDWYGMPMTAPGLAGLQLRTLLGSISWASSKFLEYANQAQAMSDGVVDLPADVDRIVDLLNAMPPVRGIPPLMIFADHVARDAPSSALQAWVDARLSSQQRAELSARVQEIVEARLALWYREDTSPASIEADLTMLDAAAGKHGWQRALAKPVTLGTIEETIGKWLQDVYRHLGQKTALVVELYLPRSMLISAALDNASIPLADGDVVRLGEDHTALLRCTDRYKAQTKRQRWSRRAPNILMRLGQQATNRVRWADASDAADALKVAFLSDAANAPVWLGFDMFTCNDAQPLDSALSEGLPAVFWLRADDAVTIATLKVILSKLLMSPLPKLPATLHEWRESQPTSTGRSVSVLLDDPEHFPAIWKPWAQP